MQTPRLMRDCPKYNTCSVPICPLDPDWAMRTMLSNEPTCPWISESVKPEAAANFESVEVLDLLPWIDHIRPQICEKFPKIKTVVASAMLSSSKIANAQAAGERLAALRKESEIEPDVI